MAKLIKLTTSLMSTHNVPHVHLTHGNGDDVDITNNALECDQEDLDDIDALLDCGVILVHDC